MPNLVVFFVTASFHQGHFIAETIRSVLSQGYASLEHVAVADDGSTDSSSREIAAIQDQRIVYLRQESAGLARTRNSGSRSAQGQYIALLDGDDSYLPNKLEL